MLLKIERAMQHYVFLIPITSSLQKKQLHEVLGWIAIQLELKMLQLELKLEL